MTANDNSNDECKKKESKENGQGDKKEIPVNEKYKSSELILQYVYNEYCRENERRKNLEARIPILITVATFFGGFILINSPIDLRTMLDNSPKIAIVFIILQVFSWLGLVGGIGCFISILMAREYRSINIDGFADIKPQGTQSGLIAYDLLKAYKQCLEFNKGVNDNKFKITNNGIVLLIVSIIIFLGMNIALFFI